MATPYVGEIRMFAGNFAPVGWMLCQGQLLPISDNEVLFNLIGTTYGGDGIDTFALPDLQSRVPVHVGPGFSLGQAGGAESVTLTTSQLPAHSHVPQGAATGNQSSPAGAVWAGGTRLYTVPPANSPMSPVALQGSGGSQPHDNMLPYLVVNFIISLSGIFPSQS
ncbi:MAG TPA: tail fiber protein [Actinomycetota bacterium]|nr:tail fiber protein [Actinomycetota bacterium]